MIGRHLSYGLQTYDSHKALERHRHSSGYIALVVSGGYVEAGDRGRFLAEAGQAVVHRPFEAHCNWFESTNALVLDLPLPPSARLPAGLYACADAEQVLRLASTDPWAASRYIGSTLSRAGWNKDDWPDLLARDLSSGKPVRIDEWADSMGLTPQAVSRGFRRCYGLSPRRFRAEQRALRALDLLADWSGTLADLAAATEHADQAHLNRELKTLTGMSPGQLRVKFVQDARR